LVPVWECFAEPQAGEKNGVRKLPEYIGEWRKEKNNNGELYSSKAAMAKKN
jgi:hypothetical protein